MSLDSRDATLIGRGGSKSGVSHDCTPFRAENTCDLECASASVKTRARQWKALRSASALEDALAGTPISHKSVLMSDTSIVKEASQRALPASARVGEGGRGVVCTLEGGMYAAAAVAASASAAATASGSAAVSAATLSAPAVSAPASNPNPASAPASAASAAASATSLRGRGGSEGSSNPSREKAFGVRTQATCPCPCHP
mmetsp:Transcript_31732/g.69905  ORF Transcript_31732/g.69905 Transcript_31732/m.69905 type:complete len:200 (-) Transcript_31732:16-615(-)